jgi:hypothetical protein
VQGTVPRVGVPPSASVHTTDSSTHAVERDQCCRGQLGDNRHKISVDKPHRLRAAEAGCFLACHIVVRRRCIDRDGMGDAALGSPRSNAPGADVFARFPGGRLIALSAVGFNTEKTRAMVAIQADCFPSWTSEHAVCQRGRHVALEKKDGIGTSLTCMLDVFGLREAPRGHASARNARESSFHGLPDLVRSLHC